jgi:hypothetical protein
MEYFRTKCLTITLTDAGYDTGPFNLYSDYDGFLVPFEPDIPKTSLLTGYTSCNVPYDATVIRIASNGFCDNYIDTIIQSQPAGKFITEWTVSGNTANRTITLPLSSILAYGYDVYAIVDWGDGTPFSLVTGVTDINRIHTYTNNGIYNVAIEGRLSHWSFRQFPNDRLKITDIINWGTYDMFSGFSSLNQGFYNCNNLKSTGKGKIRMRSGLTTVNFYATFAYCNPITEITPGLFDNLTQSNVQFNSTFGVTENLKTIPPYLFDSCTGITSCQGIFEGCINLETIPYGLFYKNVNCLDFGASFWECHKLEINPWIFYLNDSDKLTRFLNQSVYFSLTLGAGHGTFERDAFTGIQGQAPDLWNCDFGTGIPITNECFRGLGNSLTSISNYNDIPIGWIT